MQQTRADPGFERVGTLDIETTHWKPADGEVVSIGVGVYDVDSSSESATYDLFHRTAPTAADEVELVDRALEQLTDYGADGLVSYNGRGFDLDFLRARLAQTGSALPTVAIDTPETHIDLFESRKQQCDRTGEKWPSLEDCLAAYGLPVPKTVWQGEELTNGRFGGELGPAYLDSLSTPDDGTRSTLLDVIEHYLRTDLEANFAVYGADIGTDFSPRYLGVEAEF